MSLVRAPARCATMSTCRMALSVEELGRNVPPTATMYGAPMTLDPTRYPQSYSVTGAGSARTKRWFGEPNERYEQQIHPSQRIEDVVDPQSHRLGGNDMIDVFK